MRWSGCCWYCCVVTKDEAEDTHQIILFEIRYLLGTDHSDWFLSGGTNSWMIWYGTQLPGKVLTDCRYMTSSYHYHSLFLSGRTTYAQLLNPPGMHELKLPTLSQQHYMEPISALSRSSPSSGGRGVAITSMLLLLLELIRFVASLRENEIALQALCACVWVRACSESFTNTIAKWGAQQQQPPNNIIGWRNTSERKSESVIAAASQHQQQTRRLPSTLLYLCSAGSNNNTWAALRYRWWWCLSRDRQLGAFDCLVACVSRSCPRRERTTGWSAVGLYHFAHTQFRVVICWSLLMTHSVVVSS